MADSSDVEQVRRNANIDPDDTKWTFAVISAYVDLVGVAGATARLWDEKAASYADLVDISEAGAQERLGQLHDHAIAQQKLWRERYTAEITVDPTPRARTMPLVRDSAG